MSIRNHQGFLDYRARRCRAEYEFYTFGKLVRKETLYTEGELRKPTGRDHVRQGLRLCDNVCVVLFCCFTTKVVLTGQENPHCDTPMREDLYK